MFYFTSHGVIQIPSKTGSRPFRGRKVNKMKVDNSSKYFLKFQLIYNFNAAEIV